MSYYQPGDDALVQLFADTTILDENRPVLLPPRSVSENILDICELYAGKELPKKEDEEDSGIQWLVDYLELPMLIKMQEDFQNAPSQSFGRKELKAKLEEYNPNLGFTEEDFGLAFLKMDADNDGLCDWHDFIGYLLYEFKSKETLESPGLHQLELPINEPAVIIPSRHRHAIISIQYRPYIKTDRTWDYSNGKYLTISSDGAMNTWSLNMELEKTQYAVYPKGRIAKPMATSVICITDANLICMGTTDRDLRFFDISGNNYHLKVIISNLHQAVTAMTYYFPPDCEDESLLFGGDLLGKILVVKFKTKSGGPFHSLLAKVRTDYITIRCITIENGDVDGIQMMNYGKIHFDWIQQINYLDEPGLIISCQNKSKRSLVVFDAFIGKIRSVFEVPKGVNVFCIVEDADEMLFVTGGLDCIVRVWNSLVTLEPIATFYGHHSPIIALVAQNKGTRIFSLSFEKVFKVWDTNQKSCIMTVPAKLQELGRELPITTYYNPEYRRFIAANYKIAIFRLGTAVNHFYTDGYTHIAGVTKALYNPLFHCLVTVGMDSNILTWNPFNGRKIFMVQNAHVQYFYGEIKAIGITSATFGPSMIHLLTGAVDGSVKMWNFTVGACLRNLSIEPNCCVTGLYWIPNRLLAMGWNKHVTEWEDSIDLGDSKNWPSYHTDDITASAICMSSILATGTYSGELIFLKLPNGQPYKIHFVGNPNLDNKVGFAKRNLDVTSLKKVKRLANMEQENICPCTQTKRCECDWNCDCLENCDCIKTGKCKCNQTKFFAKEAKALEELEAAFDNAFKSDGSSRQSRSRRSGDESRKKKKQQAIFSGVAGRMEIHTLYFLTTRENNPETGSLLVSLQNGWVQLWSRHPEGTLVSAFYAIHMIGDYVTAMNSNENNSFLFTGHAFGYVKIWHIPNWGRPGEPVKVKMPLLRLAFPFLMKDIFPGRAKRAARDQPEPMLLSSCRNHVSKVSYVELIEPNKIYITSGLDKTVRFWTYGGQYIGTLGSSLPWPEIPKNKPYLPPPPYRVPPDLKRVLSSTSLKVLTDHYAKSPDEINSEEDKRFSKRIIESRELIHEIYPNYLTEPILGKFHKLTDVSVKTKRPPKLNLQEPVLRVLNFMKTTEMQPVERPKTPDFAALNACESDSSSSTEEIFDEEMQKELLKEEEEKEGEKKKKKRMRKKEGDEEEEYSYVSDEEGVEEEKRAEKEKLTEEEKKQRKDTKSLSGSPSSRLDARGAYLEEEFKEGIVRAEGSESEETHSSSGGTPSIVRQIKAKPRGDYHLDLSDIEDVLDYLEDDYVSSIESDDFDGL